MAAPGCSSVSVPELETVCLTGGEGPCTGTHPSGKGCWVQELPNVAQKSEERCGAAQSITNCDLFIPAPPPPNARWQCPVNLDQVLLITIGHH